jgi:hypothetical protein
MRAKVRNQSFLPVFAQRSGQIQKAILDVFQNPVGFGMRPAVSQAKACGLKSGETAFLSGSCSETEVSEQLY